MAMSLKKIGAMAIGGAMVATALASGVAADVTVVGDVTKDLFVKDGQPNCYVVVGANAPSTMDVVSAADIAAKIGSLCYKEGTVEDGSADITIHAEADSDDYDLKHDKYHLYQDNNYTLFVAASDNDYADEFEYAQINTSAGTFKLDNLTFVNVFEHTPGKVLSLSDLSTMLKIEDIDPDDWFDNDYYKINHSIDPDGDAGEIVMVNLKNDTDNGWTVEKKDALYMVLAYQDDEENLTKLVPLREGMHIPFLGKEQVIVDFDDDDDYIYLGTPVFEGVLKAGETYDVGNGYTVKVADVLKDNNGNFKVEIDILKDGKVVSKAFDTVNPDDQPLTLVYGDVGVVVHAAWMDVAETNGYAELVIAKDVKCLDLGEDYIGDWEAYAVVKDGNKLELSDQIDDDTNSDDKIVGIALRFEGTNDEYEDLDDGDTVPIADYVDFKFDNKDKPDKLYVYFTMDKKVDATLNIGQKVSALNADVTLKGIKANAIEPVSLTAPIAKLDTEVSLDDADKNLVLVGGPVANKLTKELQDSGKLPVAINNTTGPVIEVVKGVANGHDVVVVAGGDREKTREAALKLIKML